MRGSCRSMKAGEVRAFVLGATLASAALLASGSVGAGDLVSWRPPWPPDSESGSVSGAGWERRLVAEAPPCEIKFVPSDGGPKLSLPLYYSLPIILGLVSLSGLFSGLTLGLMGLDVIGLQIVARGGNEELARCAKRIAPLRENGNMLLCTLLLGNVSVNSALSILTADIASGLTGFFVSTFMIVIFGEILPQACCARYALQVGARTVPIVKFMICLFYVFTKPLACMLDWMLGKEMGTIMDRKEILEMLKLQISLGAVDAKDGEMAKQVAEGAISFRDKRAADIMTPMEDMYVLSSETRLGYETIREIFETGFSRVPVYGKDKHDYVGLLYTKDLMLCDPEDEMKLGDFIPIFHRKVETFFGETKLVDALNAFQKGGTHMGLVRQTNVDDCTAPRFEIAGVVTLEDIMEEIIQEEIVDETDVYVDVDKHIFVGDGREKDTLNLGVFDPVWKNRRERLSRDEIGAISAHLSRVAFFRGSTLQLGIKAVEWLVASSQVKTMERVTVLGVEVPDDEDWLYRYGHVSECCTLVLQGRVNMMVGRDGFRSEAGAFSVLGKDALLPRDYYEPDFSAHVSTREVRLLVISKSLFQRAQALDKDPEALQEALCSLASFCAGEISRKEARTLRSRSCLESSSPDDHDEDDRDAPSVNPIFEKHSQGPDLTGLKDDITPKPQRIVRQLTANSSGSAGSTSSDHGQKPLGRLHASPQTSSRTSAGVAISAQGD
mmetsp:Transcript_99891/g.320511  ORF Transcript_99891/g.320511 Transcript_99891/m.320511 type:complete len:723 (-) Transcript_99891:195-2363(-)